MTERGVYLRVARHSSVPERLHDAIQLELPTPRARKISYIGRACESARTHLAVDILLLPTADDGLDDGVLARVVRNLLCRRRQGHGAGRGAGPSRRWGVISARGVVGRRRGAAGTSCRPSRDRADDAPETRRAGAARALERDRARGLVTDASCMSRVTELRVCQHLCSSMLRYTCSRGCPCVLVQDAACSSTISSVD
jgi:hypothetical protein